MQKSPFQYQKLNEESDHEETQNHQKKAVVKQASYIYRNAASTHFRWYAPRDLDEHADEPRKCSRERHQHTHTETLQVANLHLAEVGLYQGQTARDNAH